MLAVLVGSNEEDQAGIGIPAWMRLPVTRNGPWRANSWEGACDMIGIAMTL
jgi:hypothetical protein